MEERETKIKKILEMAKKEGGLLPPTYSRPHSWDGTEEGIRIPTKGAKGHRIGDYLKVTRHQGNWRKARDPEESYKALIVQRYYTINGPFRNYSHRVKILEGPWKGRYISFQ